MAAAKGKAKVASKLCIRCRKVQPLGDFHGNSVWKEQNYCDVYCKDCAKKMVKDKDTIREYFWMNNRLWDERIWESAAKKAEYILARNPEYIKTGTTKTRREEIENEETAKQCLNIMNMRSFYKYSANITEDGEYNEFDPESTDGTLILTPEGNEELGGNAKSYSKDWNGVYTQQDLLFLDEFFEQLQNDFSLGDIVMLDAARRVAKAALADDKAYNAMLEGRGTVKDWRDAHDVYEKILQSTNFAASQRKGGNNNDMKAIGTIIAAVEIKRDIAELCRKQLFEPDDIDKILRDFRHTEVAIQ